ncbi:hypothetical protein LZ575_14870 [Antarcticibacterium sp. 1MA-6-2]|uniref:hypothetical protein n=1 Tax=Antarcticibacterium sp. 1MA-6-2 TaxID=2908210 RepID=UPI001F3871F4|nr:hypothetical protein [Antarcticibacterium sp. 1MA-6-2]UJH90180.1 hypothetical protein LZ575_14870 [Antarcticibacterium sp. 1MA-6-2]
MQYYKPQQYFGFLIILGLFLACSDDKIEEIVDPPEDPPTVLEPNPYQPGDTDKIQSNTKVLSKGRAH